jgi:hypothetical protein
VRGRSVTVWRALSGSSGVPLIFLGVGLCRSLPDPAWASSCGDVGPPLEEFERAELVFVGRVVGVETVRGCGGCNPVGEVTFEVTEAFKGTLDGETVVLEFALGSCGLGGNFHGGEHHLMFVGRELRVSGCSPMMFLFDGNGQYDYTICPGDSGFPYTDDQGCFRTEMPEDEVLAVLRDGPP